MTATSHALPTLRRPVVLCLGESQVDGAAAIRSAAHTEGRLEEIAVSDLPKLIRATDRSHGDLVIAGRPPPEELGAWCRGVAAAALRPRRVVELDLDRQRGRISTPWRYVLETSPRAMTQLGAGAAALATQRLLAQWLLHRRTRRSYHKSNSRRYVYLRPLVGASAAVGGSITHTFEIIRALGCAGYAAAAITSDPQLVATSRADPQPPCDWTLTPVPWAFRALPASAAAGGDAALLRAGMRTAGMNDFIYQRHARFSLCGAVLAVQSGRPLFLEYNGPESFFNEAWQRVPFGRLLALCERAALHTAARIFVVSDVDARELRSFGIEAERIVVTPNGVDATRFARGGGHPLRRKLEIPPERQVIGFLGSFGPWHGAPTLARAFTKVAELQPSAHLLLVGDGPEHRETVGVVSAAGLANNLSVAGRISPDLVPAYLDACDVLVSPHVPLPHGREFFGSPTKLFEYMAAGKPIVASALGQIGQVLRHEQNALLVTPGGEHELAAAIARLLRERTLAERLGRQAREDAIRDHSWDRNARQIVAAYRELTR